MRSHSYIVVCICALLLAGCATRYVERDPNKEDTPDTLGDVVVSRTGDGFRHHPPKCIGVLPLQATQKDFYPTEDIRRAIHSHLAPTGVRLIPLQKVDTIFKKELSIEENLASLQAATQCDSFIAGEVFEKKSRFFGVYSEVRIGAKLRILQLGSKDPVWEGKHTAIIRDGGIPLNPISALAGAVSAGSNLRQEQVTRTTHDLARRLVHAIPGLKFQEEAELKAPIALANDSTKGNHDALARVKEKLKAADPGEAEAILVDALSGDQWPDVRDREALATILMAQAPNNPVGYAEMARIKLAAGQAAIALNYAKKLVQLQPGEADHQFLLGRVLLKLDRPEDATEPFLKAAGASIPKAMYFSGLGMAYAQQSQNALAIAAYKKSIEIEPNSPFTLLQLGLAYTLAGDEEAAAQSIRKSIIVSIANQDKLNADNGLKALTSLGLELQFGQEDLAALQEKIKQL